jgi:hypothetical protein
MRPTPPIPPESARTRKSTGGARKCRGEARSQRPLRSLQAAYFARPPARHVRKLPAIEMREGCARRSGALFYRIGELMSGEVKARLRSGPRPTS